MCIRFFFCCLFSFSASAAVFGQDAQKKDSISSSVIDEVVVTGAQRTEKEIASPYSISVIDKEKLEMSGKGQLLSALSGSIPSLFVTERSILGFGISSGGSGGIKIRGIGGQPTSGVLMTIDGQPQFAGLFSHHIADSYGKEYVERVEVVRGPGSLRYGSNAMGGVINVVTKNADKDGCHTTLSTQYGSYNTTLNNLTNTFKRGRFSSLLSLGFDRTDGAQEGLFFKQGSLYAKVRYNLNKHFNLQADYSLMKFIADDPVYPKIYANDPDAVYHQNIVRGNASVSMENKHERSSGFARLYYGYGNHHIQDPSPFHGLDDRWGVLIHQDIDTWKDGTLAVGFDFSSYSGEIPLSGGMDNTQAPLATLKRKNITEYSPYATLNHGFLGKRINVEAGVRMANSNMFGTHWVPQVGISAQPHSDWTVKGSVSSGFRNPSFKDLYLYKMANPDLMPEEMVNVEMAVQKSFSRIATIELTGFLSKGKNMITIANGKNANTGNFTNMGIEVVLNSSPFSWISTQANYSFLHSSVKDLTAAPHHQYYLALNVIPHDKWKLCPIVKGVGGLYVSAEQSNVHYTTLGMKVSFQATKWLHVFASADNLTDKEYCIIKGYEMPGINFLGGIKLNLDFQ